MAKLLIASLVDPDTHPGGAGTYTRGLVEALRRGKSGHRVTLVGPLHTPPGPWYRTRQVVSLAGSCFSSIPAKALFSRRHEFKMRIRETFRSNDFDLVLINGSDMLWASHELPPEMPTVLIALNLEHELLIQQQAQYRILRPMLKRETAKQREYEIDGFHRARGVIFPSLSDMAWGIAHVPRMQALHLPPLFANSSIPRKSRPRGQLCLGFLADFAWWPNRQNWMWFLNEILPKVRRPLSIQVFGRQSDRIPISDRIVVHGFVHGLAAIWDQVDIIVCPVRAGAGVSIKAAESLYNRVPIIATTKAVRSFECSSGPGLAVRDKAEEWIHFLNSSEVEQLASQVPSEQLCRQFEIDQHVEKLDNFIIDVTG
jgi:hypothetical protein